MKRTVSLTHSLTHSLTILLVIILLFLPVSAALAGYLGPDRTRTESDVETYDYGVWASRDDLSCSPTNDPPACIQCTWERDPFTAPCAINPPTDRYYWYKLGTRSEVVTRTVTYPEAVINGALNGCTLQNGWCVTSPALALNASEPVAGYAITLIEGARNGEAFACNGASCDVPLLEGENNFTFWALSSWGDSSRMGTLTARVDTQPPLVNGEISGTPGEAGWYVSPVTVRASASDPQPGSGIQALTYALNGGAWTPYTAPLTVSDGVHSVTFRAADAAGHSAEASASVRVDTLPPQVDASLAGEQVNGWYLSQVTLSASASDPSAGSGLARIEYAPDGGAWQSYAVPVTFGGGTHTVQVRAIDMAGNLSEPAWLTFRVDGTAPRIQLSDAWYIWQTGEVKVSDEGSGLAGVEIQIRDPQGRWQKVVRAYEVNGGSFSTTIAWDRTFADGTLAPIGTYDVMVTARDLAGNESRETAHIIISAPGVTPAPLPTRRVEPVETRIPQPQTTDNCPLMTDDCSLPAPAAAPQSSFILSPTRAAVVSAFQSSARQSPNLQSNNLQSNNRQSPAPLFDAAALAAIAAATAYALEQRRKRKDEEARQRAEAQREAARRNAAEEARKAQAYLLAQIAAQQAAQEQSASHRGEEAKIERMEEAEGAAKAAKPQRGEQAYQAYRAGERAEYVTSAQATLQDLGITLDSKFSNAETQTIINGASKLAMAMGGNDVFRDELGGVSILKDNNMRYGGLGDKNKVIYNTGAGWGEWRVVHELAHAWDANHGWSLSRELKQKTGGSFSLKGIISYWLGACDPTQPGCNHAGYVWGDVPPKGADGNFDQREDFAESVAAYLYPEEAKSYINENFPEERFKRFQYDSFLDRKRGKFIEELMKRVAGGEK